MSSLQIIMKKRKKNNENKAIQNAITKGVTIIFTGELLRNTFKQLKR